MVLWMNDGILIRGEGGTDAGQNVTTHKINLCINILYEYQRSQGTTTCYMIHFLISYSSQQQEEPTFLCKLPPRRCFTLDSQAYRVTFTMFVRSHEQKYKKHPLLVQVYHSQHNIQLQSNISLCKGGFNLSQTHQLNILPMFCTSPKELRIK